MGREDRAGAACSGDNLGTGNMLEGVQPSGEVSVAGTMVLEAPASGWPGGLLRNRLLGSIASF